MLVKGTSQLDGYYGDMRNTTDKPIRESRMCNNYIRIIYRVLKALPLCLAVVVHKPWQCLDNDVYPTRYDLVFVISSV